MWSTIHRNWIGQFSAAVFGLYKKKKEIHTSQTILWTSAQLKSICMIALNSSSPKNRNICNSEKYIYKKKREKTRINIMKMYISLSASPVRWAMSFGRRQGDFMNVPEHKSRMCFIVELAFVCFFFVIASFHFYFVLP